MFWGAVGGLRLFVGRLEGFEEFGSKDAGWWEGVGFDGGDGGHLTSLGGFRPLLFINVSNNPRSLYRGHTCRSS